MRNALSPLLATASVLALVTWLYLGGSDTAGGGSWAPTQDTTAAEEMGSRKACAVPLAWRVGSIHPAFGLTREDVEAAVSEATSLWEEAAEASLFRFDSGGGFPIRLVHDDRQARGEERRRYEAELRRAEEEMEAWREELRRRTEELQEAQSRHDTQVTAFQDRLSRYNERVREWNERGDTPSEVVAELRRTEESLETERRRLQERAREIEEAAQALNEEQAEFNRAVDEFNRTSAGLEQRFPPERVESGVYRETVETVNGRIQEVGREILIYRFDDRDQLVRVIAHELGHALGLGHSPVTGAIMSEEHEEASAAPRIHASDVELLQERCPGL